MFTNCEGVVLQKIRPWSEEMERVIGDFLPVYYETCHELATCLWRLNDMT